MLCWKRQILALALTGSSLLLSCSSTDPLTELIVVVDTDMSVPAVVDSVRISVDSSAIDGGSSSRTLDLRDDRPATLGLVHRGGPLGPLHIEVVGLQNESTFITRTAEVSFVAKRVRALRMNLLTSCLGVECPDGETCGDSGFCRNETVSADELESWTGDLEPMDADITDGDADSDADADMDADIDDIVDADLDADECVPADEICNEIDDDCDGWVDEDTDFGFDSGNCGACDNECGEQCIARACSDALVAIATGQAHSCALDGSGGVLCWGDNGAGQLGDGTTDARVGPVAVDGLPESGDAIVEVAVGSNHSCARSQSGSVWCWGSGSAGQLGNGGAEGPGPSMVELSGQAAISLGVGSDHSCVVLESGEARCWGDGNDGRLGNDAEESSPLPVPVSTIADAIQITAGEAHTCVVSETGTVSCWGSNDSNLLGSAGPSSSVPVRITDSEVSSVRQIVAGRIHNCVLRTDGEVLCWGNAGDGRLGNGTTSTMTPQLIAAPDARPLQGVWIAAGGAHSCVLRRDGTSLCWGSDAEGQLGRGLGSGRALSPVETLLAPGTRIAAGELHSCARLMDESIRCWGSNSSNQVATGSTDNRPSPVPVE